MTLQSTKICLVKPTDILSRNHLLHKGLKQQFRSKCTWQRVFFFLSFEVLLSSLISNRKKTAKIIRFFLPSKVTIPRELHVPQLTCGITMSWLQSKPKPSSPSREHGPSALSNARDPESVMVSWPWDSSPADGHARRHPRNGDSGQAARWCR